MSTERPAWRKKRLRLLGVERNILGDFRIPMTLTRVTMLGMGMNKRSFDEREIKVL
ncbi:hypothetical protein [Candidatus Williamhamiltonella defendens]|uniref:hypothetical protein n=1 Tax=Candidatus Williamhamiltonella defendens TaxID=138072 RepID=UPI0015823CA9|nr:hypothetical protein [Candidatus Hamiltonella defensa]